MTETYQNIWLTSEEKMYIATQAIPVSSTLHEDKGVLEIQPTALAFQGQTQSRQMSQVKEAHLIHHQSPKAVRHLITGMFIAITIVAIFYSVMVFSYTFVTGLTILNDVVRLVGVLLLVVVAIGWFLHLGPLGPVGSSWWVKVDYLDEEEQPQTIYFADGSKMGWGGKLGGTKKLYETIRQRLTIQPG